MQELPEKVKIFLFFNPILIASTLVLGGCSLVTNTLEAPFVAVDHMINGKNYRDGIKRLAAENEELEREKDEISDQASILESENKSLETEILQLARDIRALKTKNSSLSDRARAFDVLVSVLEENPCIHVDRNGAFSLLIQPKITNECVE